MFERVTGHGAHVHACTRAHTRGKEIFYPKGHSADGSSGYGWVRPKARAKSQGPRAHALQLSSAVSPCCHRGALLDTEQSGLELMLM